MTRNEVGNLIMSMVESVGQSFKSVSFATYKQKEDRSVTVIVVPTERWGEVKSALEEVFQRIDEEFIQ